MASWTPTRSTASTRSTGSVTVPPSRAYQNAFGSRTPVSARRAGITSPAQASPQVKQRLAELRRAKLAAASASEANNNSIDGATSPSDEQGSQLDAASICRPSSSTSSFSLEAGSHLARTPSPAASEVTIELGIRSLQAEVDKAKKTGRLHVAGRSLEEVPPLVFEQLLPRSSIYHPSNATPSQSLSSLAQKTEDIDLSGNVTADNVQDEEVSRVPWWEVESLTTLKASNNELSTIPSALAGFESLEVLDLHANKLATPFPASFGYLANLTNVNLSNNEIDVWPVELMALVHLKVLDLSHNRIPQLWGLDWKADITRRMKDVKRDTQKMAKIMRAQENGDSSFDSIDSQSTAGDSSAGEDFWSAFSTAPVKTRARAYMPTKSDTDYTAPLPSLTSLNLSHNKLSAKAFSSACIVSLPPSLTCIDLSSNNISGRVPLQLFGCLSKLKILNLADNGLDDNFFSSGSSKPDHVFQSLESLDLARNAIDSLEHLEQVFRIPLERQAVYSGLASASLAKVLSAIVPAEPLYTPLHINLSSNFLREEIPRRKQMKRGKKQEDDFSTTAETQVQEEENEAPVALLNLLDEVHASLSQQLKQKLHSQETMSEMMHSLNQLLALAGQTPAAQPSTPPSPSKANGHRFGVPRLKTALGQSQTPVKMAVQEPPGSSRARRQRLEQEARQWAPL